MPKVLIHTSMGDITVELDKEKAPKSTENLLEYVRSKHYDGTVFHRVIDGFMIQGGGYDRELKKKPTRPPVENEADNGLKNDRGTVAMARTPDVNSATSQFFINVVQNDFLNHREKTPEGYGYAVIGKVAEGMEIVDQIKAVPTGSKGTFSKDVPQTDVVIETVTILEE
jgi:peptidyl-prolyl cis-trans isomerase B (cyclophilin B)